MNEEMNARRLKALVGLREELARLPDCNVFGDSNADDKTELAMWIAELEQERNQPEDYSNENVRLYLQGKWSPISDCLD